MIGPLISIFNNFASCGLPDMLKTARVIPLLKKGDKKEITNYRPISNLSVFSKVYERCLLKRIESEIPGYDGEHQHGFKMEHSTEMALLTLQSYIAEALDNKKIGILYSIDLSAAFDLLLPDKFFELFKDKLPDNLMYCIIDFFARKELFSQVQRCSVISY